MYKVKKIIKCKNQSILKSPGGKCILIENRSRITITPKNLSTVKINIFVDSSLNVV